jgi:hypothetical protein
VSDVLQLQLESDRFRPGDVVRGVVTVARDQDARSLEVLLIYQEQTIDYSGSVVEVGSGLLHEGDLAAGQRLPFAVALPAGALPAYRSRHGALWWEVDVKVDKRGFDVHETARIDVFPPDAAGVVFPAAAAILKRDFFDPEPPPPPGWYADPGDPGRWRWWDGLRWTQHGG